ncbi:NADPH-dependent FMN reductase [Synechococcus sp. BA-132 BA5]|uniref:NADPH-dependent FMN reductase n=1 Tax=Synechococcus sp. BA-132 BA5 TaxID=3110252 RepID=UPI002B20E921|nr:NAD(P)H-dependent oxidoreductase [Synechococcus sp. BA-132 BA5]MEA5413548.1 NAD(P)H-dependent oxidoreductase [Synechococcus sp. BA-132 BA5]
MPPDLLVLSASSGENLTLSKRFAAAGHARGMAAEVLDLTALSLPLYNPRSHAEAGLPADVAPLSERLEAAPRWVICAPEYNGSLPPVLTSAIAWLSVQGEGFRTLFNGRPIAIATHSGGPGVEVLAVLRIQLAHLGAHVVGRQLSCSRHNPAKDSSIDDIVHRLQRMEPIQP